MILPTRIPVSMGRDTVTRSVRVMRAWGIPLFAVAAVAFALLARDAQSEPLAGVYVALCVVGVVFVLIALTGPRWLRPRIVSVMPGRGGLVFSPPAVLNLALSLVAGVAMASVSRLWLEPEQWAYLGYYERGAILIGPLAGVFIIVESLWSLRRPAGLTLDERGMRGVRGGPRCDLAWPDVKGAKVVETKKQRFLALNAVDRVARIPEGAVSGDVYAVATVVNSYLQNPDERGRLVDGPDAVRHVDAEVRSRRFSSQ